MLGVEPARCGLVERRDGMRATARGGARAARARRTSRPTRRSATLSPAAQQLVEIARALAVGCRVLVLDEPTSSLGRDDVRAAVRRWSRGCKAQGHAIVYISHFIEEVKAVVGSLRRAARRAERRRRASRPRRDADAIVSLMVGRALDELYPRGAAHRGRGRPRGRRRSSRARRRSRCTAARSSASPGCSAPGARGCCARSSASSPCAADAIRVGAYAGPAAPRDAMAAGHGHAQRGPRGRRARARAERRRQPDAVAARRPRARVRWCCRRGRTRRPRRWIERARHPLRGPAPAGRASSRAAISRRSRSRGCSITTSTCCCSTSRRAASTSASKAQIYALDRRAGVADATGRRRRPCCS